MESNPNQHSNKKDSAASAVPEIGSITKMGDVNTDMAERATNTPFLKSSAARAVFETFELLELILTHLPIRTLSRTLSVSKHCRDVITSNHQLRQTLFLESTPVSEYLVTIGWKHETTTISGRPYQTRHRLLTIAQGPRQVSPDNRIIVKAHPALHALQKSHHSLQSEEYYLPNCRTQNVFCDTIKKLPAHTLLFQPPATNVVINHHGFKFWLECSEGVTFGMVAKQLEKQSSRFFGRTDEQIAEDVDVDKVPSTQSIPEARARAARKFYAQRDQSCDLSLGEPCLYLEAEGAMGGNSEVVRNTRSNMEVYKESDQQLE